MGEDDLADRCARIALAVTGVGDLDGAIADVHRLPADLPARSGLAAALLGAIMRSGLQTGPHLLRQVDGLLTIAETNPPSTSEWRRVRAGAKAMALLSAAEENRLPDVGRALREIDELAAEIGADPSLAALFDSARMALTYKRALQEGDESALRHLQRDFEKLSSADVVSDNPQMRVARDAFAGWTAVMDAYQRGDDVSGPLEAAMREAESLPHGHPLRAAVQDAGTSLRMLLRPGSAKAEDLDAAVALASRPGLGEADRAIFETQAAFTMLDFGSETDLGRIDAAIARLRDALRLSAPDSPQRAFHLTSLALALYRRAEVTNSITELDEAVALLEDARERLGGPHHPQWSLINDMLSTIRQRLGRTPQSHKEALDGLRGNTMRVLLQADVTAARLAARDAARDAIDVARRCIQAGDVADAIQALDAGRGLVLFAATEIPHVVDRLEEAGRSDLAQQWRAATVSGDPEALSWELRRDVWTVVTAHSSAGNVLDPPSLAEIRAALTAVDADALVYLIPGENVIPGYAAVVPTEGRPSVLVLPNLHLDGAVDVERYLTTSARRDAAGATRDAGLEEADQEFVDGLDALCDWAWRAAMGPLVEHYVSSLTRSASGRPPRVVLVPMGELARIPWQAARKSDGTYAVRWVAVSQAASARMLCHTADLAPVPATPSGLVVGDPDTGAPGRDLRAGRLEAYAIRQSFYRGARYIGRRPDDTSSPSGAGTPDEVRAWLTGSGPAAGAMLHLACHGFIQTEPGTATSYLLLAGGDRVTAEELTEVMARAPERAIGLVVLAACRTGLAVSGYDEAYSLGTAFLAAGVRSVLSTQWSIPDDATSVLMYMFHHYRMSDGVPAWDALRRAQLWMLDEKRQIPDQMPMRLREQLIGTDLEAVVGWAGFVHWGQ